MVRKYENSFLRHACYMVRNERWWNGSEWFAALEEMAKSKNTDCRVEKAECISEIRSSPKFVQWRAQLGL